MQEQLLQRRHLLGLLLFLLTELMDPSLTDLMDPLLSVLLDKETPLNEYSRECLFLKCKSGKTKTAHEYINFQMRRCDRKALSQT